MGSARFLWSGFSMSSPPSPPARGSSCAQSSPTGGGPSAEGEIARFSVAPEELLGRGGGGEGLPHFGQGEKAAHLRAAAGKAEAPTALLRLLMGLDEHAQPGRVDELKLPQIDDQGPACPRQDPIELPFELGTAGQIELAGNAQHGCLAALALLHAEPVWHPDRG